MGHKIRPDSFRLGITYPWQARWFVRGSFAKHLEEDEIIRKTITALVVGAGVARIDIERTDVTYRIFIKAARPGLIIGRGGKGVEQLTKAIKEALMKLFRKRGQGAAQAIVNLNIEELRRSEISAVNVAQNMASDLERRLPVRRTMKRHLETVMQNREILGAKIRVSGRLDGAEISRREWLLRGKLPLSTLRANIDYGEATAFTTYGTVGIKAWIYKGEVFSA